MPWPLTVSTCLSAGIVIGFIVARSISTLTIEDAERRAFNAQADHQKGLADKWKRIADPRITEQVTELETRRQRRQQGGFGY